MNKFIKKIISKKLLINKYRTKNQIDHPKIFNTIIFFNHHPFQQMHYACIYRKECVTRPVDINLHWPDTMRMQTLIYTDSIVLIFPVFIGTRIGHI